MIHQSLPPLYSWKEIKGRFLLLASEEQAQQTLTRFYRQLSKDEKTINHWAYGNTIKFSFFIRHAITFFNEANHSVLMIKPLLLFYGLTNFKKALLLLYDPDYPKTSRVLQHGLTTRKKKRSLTASQTMKSKYNGRGYYLILQSRYYTNRSPLMPNIK